ncbi:MAG: hypothetical protein ACJ0DK_08490 [Planctomycetota bacterium]
MLPEWATTRSTGKLYVTDQRTCDIYGMAHGGSGEIDPNASFYSPQRRDPRRRAAPPNSASRAMGWSDAPVPSC